MLVIERFADPIVSLPPDAFRKREPVQLRSVITGKIGSPVTIRQPHVDQALCRPNAVVSWPKRGSSQMSQSVHMGHKFKKSNLVHHNLEMKERSLEIAIWDI